MRIGCPLSESGFSTYTSSGARGQRRELNPEQLSLRALASRRDVPYAVGPKEDDP